MRTLALLALTSLLAGCHSLAAKSAGSVGCPPNEISVSSVRGGLGADTWTATCRGHRFICTDNKSGGSFGKHGSITVSQVNCHPELEESGGGGANLSTEPGRPSSPAATAGAPSGAAGFELGATVAATQSACEGAQHGWTEVGTGAYQCDGAAKDVGFKTKVVTHFREGKCADIVLIRHPESKWLSSYIALRKTLTAKYGAAAQTSGEVSEDCRTDEALMECMGRGEVRVHAGWRWSTGESVDLSLGKPENGGGTAAIRVRYARPVGGGTPKPDSL